MDSVLREIPGALPQLDAFLFLEICRIQAEEGIQGDLLEIGAAHGTSASILAKGWRTGERFLVCDLFGLPSEDDLNRREQEAWGYDSIERTSFENNFRRFHSTLPEIWQRSSTSLFEANVKPRSVRFAHVDGSHLFRIVKSDLEFVHTALSHDGIVAFDDVFTGHAPGVGAAVWQCIESTGLRPLFASTQKLYATWGEEGAFTTSQLRQILDEFGSDIFEDVIHGQVVLSGRPRKRQDVSGLKKAAAQWVPPKMITMLRQLKVRKRLFRK